MLFERRMKTSGAVVPEQEMNAQTIMVVDDDPLVRRLLERFLTNGGYRVVVAETGFGLSETVRENRPDLLLLDVNMPGLRGDAALSVLQQLGQRFESLDVPVVFHSGMPPAELDALARKHGAVGYLHKPAGREQLLELVDSVLGQASSQAAAV